MHKFDNKIIELVGKILKDKNETENRIPKAISRNYDKIRIRYNNLKRKRKRKIKLNRVNNIIKNREKYKIDKKELRKTKSLQFKTNDTSQARNKLFFSYTRYADDWLILTNADVNTCTVIKSEIEKWLKENLKLKLSPEKTLVTDLKKNSVKFLGFAIKYSGQQKVYKYKRKDIDTVLRRRLNIGPGFSIDKERVLKRLKTEGIINEKLQPIHSTKFILKKTLGSCSKIL
jgi:hypothetical protein